MNKEQAITALRRALKAAEDEEARETEGTTASAYASGEAAGFQQAFHIIDALPDETPTVLTREILDEVIDGASKRKFPIWWAGQQFADGVWAMVQLRDALLALSPVVVEGRPCANCSTSLVRCYDVSNPWATPRKVKCCPDCDHRPVRTAFGRSITGRPTHKGGSE